MTCYHSVRGYCIRAKIAHFLNDFILLAIWQQNHQYWSSEKCWISALIIRKGLIYGHTYVQVPLVLNPSQDQQDTQRKTSHTCVLIVLVHHTPLSPRRWQNITGLPRATSPMKPPPTKPSSAPSLHRYTHMFQHQQHKRLLSPVLDVYFFFSALKWLTCVSLSVSNSAGHLGLRHSVVKREGAVWQQ